MKKYKVYLFDFDGTLINSFPGLYHVFKRGFEAVGVEITEDQVPWLARCPLPESYAKLVGDQDEERAWKFVRAIEEALDEEEAIGASEFYPEMMQFFDILKNRDFISGIVTSNRTDHVEHVLEHFGIPLDLFDVYVGNEKVKEIKPSPKPIQKALELLNYDGDLADVVYVGDSHNDCGSAYNAGVETYQIDRGDAPKCDAPKIYSLLELFK